MSNRKEFLEGQTFNYLFVKKYINRSRYLCECLACGNETIVSSYRLRTNRIKSCGCMRNALLRSASTRHGDSYSRLYNEFYRIHSRCYGNYNAETEKIYKDRNITVCDEWYHNYPAFREWALNNGYADNLTIDRIDNERGYSPDNCRWITQLEQASNKRNNFNITIGDETHTMAEWCRINGISYTAARKRTRERGWDPIDAVTIPTRIYNKKITPNNKSNSVIHPLHRNGNKGYEISYNGKTLNAKQWSDITGISASAICWRLKHNWTIERTLSEPNRIY